MFRSEDAQTWSIPDAVAGYHALDSGYLKFFKMDNLCKWAWLGAEALLKMPDGSWRHEGLAKEKIALAIATRDGCLEVDHRFSDSIHHLASPALFVYTLPNIMLGEICIRHGFKGEQLCMVQETFPADELLFWVQDTCAHRGTEQVFFGWLNGDAAHCDLLFFWAEATTITTLTEEQLRKIYEAPLPIAMQG